jgi:DeoR family transcriptional regulator, fructose operon transcriptional repressor
MHERSVRREEILRQIAAGVSNVADMSVKLGVSPSTVRRDLQRLSADGAVMRTYGGAVSALRRTERTLSEKELLQRAEKQAIAAAAAELIPAGGSAILDAGTTIGQLSQRLRDVDGITVVTNGINTIETLATAEGVALVVLGGELRPAGQALIGGMAEDGLRNILADVAFLGCDGVVAEHGICSPTLAQTRLKSRMAMSARRVCVLADHSKLGRADLPFWTLPSGPWTLVTDDGATEERLQPFLDLPDCDVIVAPPAGAGDER